MPYLGNNMLGAQQAADEGNKTLSGLFEHLHTISNY
jgi:hypothetical protein